MHSKHFSQEEFERPIYGALTYGDEVGIAEKCGAGYGILSQKFSPDNERESDLYRAACTFTAWIEENCRDAEKGLGIFNSFVGRALPCPSTFDTSEERRKSHEERTEFHIAEAENKPLEKKIEELEESMRQDERLLGSLRAELQRFKQREAFPGQEVKHEVRMMTKRVLVKTVSGGRL